MNNQDELEVAGYYGSLSAVSRYIRMYYGQTLLAHGTCFFVMSADGPGACHEPPQLHRAQQYYW